MKKSTSTSLITALLFTAATTAMADDNRSDDNGFDDPQTLFTCAGKNTEHLDVEFRVDIDKDEVQYFKEDTGYEFYPAPLKLASTYRLLKIILAKGQPLHLLAKRDGVTSGILPKVEITGQRISGEGKSAVYQGSASIYPGSARVIEVTPETFAVECSWRKF